MKTRFWMRKLFARPPGQRPIRKAPRRARPALEVLESREVPSAVTQQFSGFTDKVLSAAGDGSLGSSKTEKGLLGTTSSTAANVNTDSVDQIHNETSIAVNPTNPLNLVASANDYQITITPTGKILRSVLSRARVTFDGGKTWNTYAVPATGYNSTGDPAVAFDADGTAYLATLAFTEVGGAITGGWAVAQHSHDGGATWSDAVKVAKGTGNPPPSAGSFPDKEYVTAWGHGNAILTYTAFNFGDNGEYISSPIFASVTHDGGTTWSTPVQISGDFIFDQGSVPTVAADGSIYVSFISSDLGTAPNFRDNYMVVKVDPNTGQPIGSPVNVGVIHDGLYDYPINVNGRETYQDSEFRSWAFGNITADPTNAKHLAVIWSDTRNNPYPDGVLPHAPNAFPDPYAVKTNSDIIVSESLDGGKTWSAPTALPLPGDQFQPWGAFDKNGNLQIGFFDREYDPANHLYGYTLATVGMTQTGQLAFTTQQLTTALSDPTKGDRWFGVTVKPNFPNATRFMGDYSNIAVTPTGVVALWTDMRENITLGGVTGHGEDAFFARTASLPSVTDANLVNVLIGLDPHK